MKPEKKTSNRRVTSNQSSPSVAKPIIELGKITALEINSGSQEKTLKNEQRRPTSLDQKFTHSSSAKSIIMSKDLESYKKEYNETSKINRAKSGHQGY